MTENFNFVKYIREEFELGEQELNSYSPLVLAYIGDGIYELIIRSMIVQKKNCAVQRLHKEATWYVKAASQAKMMDGLLPELNEEEERIYRRGRNAKSHTAPKNADLKDYRKATGFEAVIGYLFLKDDLPRITYLVKKGIQQLTETAKE